MQNVKNKSRDSRDARWRSLTNGERERREEIRRSRARLGPCDAPASKTRISVRDRERFGRVFGGPLSSGVELGSSVRRDSVGCTFGVSVGTPREGRRERESWHPQSERERKREGQKVRFW